jgi:hypothetical protein
MLPPITDPTTWIQAEQLMQPALIRLLDNLRKAIEASTWASSYDNLQSWPNHISPENRTRWLLLNASLKDAKSEEVDTIETALARLPQPTYTYLLNLTRADRTVQFDLWDLCYQICFEGYIPDVTREVYIDGSLLDDDGEVDWAKLEDKTKAIVATLIESLPTV